MYGYLNYQKKCIRKKVKKEIIASLDSSDLVLLAFTKNESTQLEWEHDKEFKYKSHMYDVVHQKEIHDSIFYWCWLDKEETILNQKLAQLSELAWNQSDEKKDKTNKIAQWGKDLYFERITSLTYPNFKCRTLCYIYFQKPITFYPTALSPPPEA